MFFVYIHTCPNGKRYIGVTIKNPEIRWNNGKGYRQNTYFYRAIQKYGWDNIEHECFTVESIGLMNYWERILIHHYNTIIPEFGYNHTSGGERIDGCYYSEHTKKKISKAMKGREVSTETRQKLSIALKGRTSPTKGKKFPPMSEETKKKLSEAMKGKTNRKGYKHSEETKRKISETLKRKRTVYKRSFVLITSVLETLAFSIC